MEETILVLGEFGTGYGLVLLAFLIGYIGGVVTRIMKIGEKYHG